jgi:hypothetical protein
VLLRGQLPACGRDSGGRLLFGRWFLLRWLLGAFQLT